MARNAFDNCKNYFHLFNHYFGGYILEKYLGDLSVIEEFENLNLNFAFLTEKVNSQFKFHFLVNHRGT